MKKYLNRNTLLEVAKYSCALILVLLIGSLFIRALDEKPLTAFKAIWDGAFVGRSSISKSIRWITPSLLAGTSALVAYKSGVFNLGIEGQIYMGAFAAAVLGYCVELPRFLHIPLCLIAAGVAGMAYAFIPAVLKRCFKINEMITTLMLNYIALLATEFWTLRLMGVDASTGREMIATQPMQETALLTKIMPPYQATTGIFVALLVLAFFYFLYKYTQKGYELRMVGENMTFAKYGGVKVDETFFSIFLLSGFIAGLCGAVEMMGAHGVFRVEFSNGLGWDGIMITLISKNNPVALFFVGSFWGCIKNGSFQMERVTNANRLVIGVIQALFVLFVTIDFRKLMDSLFPKRSAIIRGGKRTEKETENV